jgi:ABC-type thiamin/hydroxymethylpyrimidine transport system permease subunit
MIQYSFVYWCDCITTRKDSCGSRGCKNIQLFHYSKANKIDSFWIFKLVTATHISKYICSTIIQYSFVYWYDCITTRKDSCGSRGCKNIQPFHYSKANEIDSFWIFELVTATHISKYICSTIIQYSFVYWCDCITTRKDSCSSRGCCCGGVIDTCLKLTPSDAQ